MLLLLLPCSGDSSVLHCASLLRTIFASSVHTNERVHVHTERNFPKAKLDREINVPFLLNEHGDLYLLSHNNSVHIILFNLKKKIKKITSFFPKYYFNKLCFELLQNVTWTDE